MPRVKQPTVVVLAGPNGAGKTTAAPFVLRDALGVDEFVNADAIAAGLSGLAPERAAFAAGRVMLARIRELARERTSFAFETTLASRTFAPMLRALSADGYRIVIVFLALPSVGLALRRVRRRVRQGGHDVPATVVRRRFHAGISNLLTLYSAVADLVLVYDNSVVGGSIEICRRTKGEEWIVTNEKAWQRMTVVAKRR